MVRAVRGRDDAPAGEPRDTATVLRGLHRGPRPPANAAALPADACAPGDRADRLGRALDDLRLVPVAEKFGLADAFDHLTVARVPAAHRYPLAMAVPKALLTAGLAIDLRDAPAVPPSTARWLGIPRARTLAWDEDAAFAALRVQGPNAGLLRRDGGRYVVDLRILEGIPVRRIASSTAASPRSTASCVRSGSRSRADHRGRRARVGRRPPRVRLRGPARARGGEPLPVDDVVGEKLLLATLRCLDERHPVRRLLEPHFAGTLQANENSGARRLGPRGSSTGASPPGGRGWPSSSAAGSRPGPGTAVLPRDLRDRGVLDLPAYPYRDDGMVLWEALERYAAAVVDAWSPGRGASPPTPIAGRGRRSSAGGCRRSRSSRPARRCPRSRRRRCSWWSRTRW